MGVDLYFAIDYESFQFCLPAIEIKEQNKIYHYKCFCCKRNYYRNIATDEGSVWNRKSITQESKRSIKH